MFSLSLSLRTNAQIKPSTKIYVQTQPRWEDCAAWPDETWTLPDLDLWFLVPRRQQQILQVRLQCGPPMAAHGQSYLHPISSLPVHIHTGNTKAWCKTISVWMWSQCLLLSGEFRVWNNNPNIVNASQRLLLMKLCTKSCLHWGWWVYLTHQNHCKIPNNSWVLFNHWVPSNCRVSQCILTSNTGG